MDRLSYTEYNRWIAYSRIEPFGSPRDDFRFGQICSVAANLMNGSDKKTKAFEAHDFIPTFDSIEEEKRRKTIEAMNMGLKNAFAALKNLATNRKKKKYI